MCSFRVTGPEAGTSAAKPRVASIPRVLNTSSLGEKRKNAMSREHRPSQKSRNWLLLRGKHRGWGKVAEADFQGGSRGRRNDGFSKAEPLARLVTNNPGFFD